MNNLMNAVDGDAEVFAYYDNEMEDVF